MVSNFLTSISENEHGDFESFLFLINQIKICILSSTSVDINIQIHHREKEMIMYMNRFIYGAQLFIRLDELWREVYLKFSQENPCITCM